MCIRILFVFLQEKGPQLAGHLTGSASAAIFAFGIEDAHDGDAAMAAIEGGLQTVCWGTQLHRG
jgi:tetrahydromethanopterin S-methyltransferase subunit A